MGLGLERPGQYTDQVHKGKYCYVVLSRYDHLPLAIAVREIEILPPVLGQVPTPSGQPFADFLSEGTRR